MKRILAIAIALELVAAPVLAGTLFDDDGNKIDTCQGSTCQPGDTGGGSNGGGTGGTQTWTTDASATARSTSKSGAVAGAIGLGGSGGAGGQGGAGGLGGAGGIGYGGRGGAGGIGQGGAGGIGQGGIGQGGAGGIGQGGKAAATGGAGGTATGVGKVTVYGDSHDYSGMYKHYTPPSAAYAAPPTANCIVTHGVAGAAPGFSGSITTGVVNEACVRMEIARQAVIFGDPESRELANRLYKQELSKHLDEEESDENRTPSTHRTAQVNRSAYDLMMEGL